MTHLLVRLFLKNTNPADPTARQDYGTLSGVVGIILNLLLCCGKFVAGILTASISITADAFNNLTDAASSLVTLVGFRIAGRGADEDHPFGHGRMEYLSGLVVAMLIILVGVELIQTSIAKIIQPVDVTFSPISMIILIVSILVKLWMCLFNRTLSKTIHSTAMGATATDSLSDAVATTAVLVGMVVSHFTALHIDGWIGLLVAGFILRAGWGAAKDTLDPLLGQSPDPQLVQDIRDTVLDHPQIVGIHDLIIHDYGPGRSMMSLHAEVPVDADIMATHDIIDHVERELKTKFGIIASIHSDPISTDDETYLALRSTIASLLQEIHPQMTFHDFRITAGHHHTNLIFDVVVPHDCPLSEAEVRTAVDAKIKGLDPTYYSVIEVDYAYHPH